MCTDCCLLLNKSDLTKAFKDLSVCMAPLDGKASERKLPLSPQKSLGRPKVDKKLVIYVTTLLHKKVSGGPRWKGSGYVCMDMCMYVCACMCTYDIFFCII